MDKIEELLTRGVDTIYPSREELEKVLRSGKKLTLYMGFDPTGTNLHIGHMIGLKKLKQWQELGHKVIFLIGDGTGQAGDPSGKISAREKFFNQEELRQNAKAYVLQASKLLNFEGENAVEIKYNGDWLTKLGYSEILELLGHFSLQQLSERDMFVERMKRGEPVNLREFIYPLLQGYDSVAMKVDLEIGATDQTFNMLIGRTLEKQILDHDKFVMTTPLLADSTGRKIGKSEGNVIGITDKPEDLFGKIMSLSDDIIVLGLTTLTDIPMDELKHIESEMKNGANPIEFKKKLAFEIVRQLNSDEEAKHAQEYFEKTVQNKELPENIPIIPWNTVPSGASIASALTSLGTVSSNSEAKRLISEGTVQINGEVVSNPLIPFENLAIEDTNLVKVGRKFVYVSKK